MEILVNELSLDGQFSSEMDFLENGLRPILYIIKEINDIGNSILLFKKSDLFDAKVSLQFSLRDILKTGKLPPFSELTAFKSQLVQLERDPYWDMNPIQTSNSTYFFNNKNISNSSLAEASERDKFVLSFHHPDFLKEQLILLKNELDIFIDNLFKKGSLTQLAYDRKSISFEKYCLVHFAKSKLDFSQIDATNGFNLLSLADEGSFLTAFKAFSESSWHQIHNSDGLRYKLYGDQNRFKQLGQKIYKFRVSDVKRCFGYRKDDRFIVVRFALDHSLSDEG